MQDLVALLLATGEPRVDEPLKQCLVHADQFQLFPDQLEEADAVDLRLTAGGAHRIEGRLEEISIVHPRQLHRVLKGQEQAFARPLLWLQFQQVLIQEFRRTAGHPVAFTPGHYVGEGALAGAVGAHDGVNLAGTHLQI